MKKKKDQDFIDNSTFGSLPPKTVIIFLLIFIVFVIISSLVYKIIESWSYVDSLYFAIVTISTVGYGDVVPQETIGKIVNIIFTLSSFCGIFLIFRVVIGYLVDHQIAAIVRRIKVKKNDEQKSRRFFSFKQKESNLDKLADEAAKDIKDEEDIEYQHGRNLRPLVHFILYIVWLLTWTIFYAVYEKEDFSFFNALYFGIITSTTIGYGQYRPLSDGGKYFALFVMMFGTLSLAILAGSISQAFMSILRSMYKRKHNGMTPEDEYQKALVTLLELPKSGEAQLDRFDFVCEMLVTGKKCKRKEINRLLNEFDKLDINDDGVLDENDFQVYKQNTFIISNHNNNLNSDVQLTNVGSNTYNEDDPEDVGLR